MRVKQLKINSFRGIGDLTLDFPENAPTVFIGDNGVGKSSILDCLAILLSFFLDISINSLTSEWEPNNRSREINYKRLFTFQDISNRGNQSETEITVLINSIQVNWSLKSERGSSETGNAIVNTPYNLQELRKFVPRLSNEVVSGSDKNIPLLVIYPVNRAIIDINLELEKHYRFDPISAYDGVLSGGQVEFGSFFQWFRNWEDLENEERRDNPDYRDRQLEAVREAISSLMPEFSNLRVRRSPLRMTVKKQGEELIINQLSDGEKCLLAMVGDLARRLAIANPGLENPL